MSDPWPDAGVPVRRGQNTEVTNSVVPLMSVGMS